MRVIRLFNFFLNRLRNLFMSYLCGFKKCGTGLDISFPCVITGAGNIEIGNNFSSLGSLYLYGNEGSIRIGNDVSLNTNVQIGSSGSKIILGNNVLIGPNVVLRAADHSYFETDKPIRQQGHVGAPIIIDDDVWIGANTVILKGVHVKKGAVVGAGSVVVRDVDAFSVVAGSPAKKLFSRNVL